MSQGQAGEEAFGVWKQALGSVRGAAIQEMGQEGRVGRAVDLLSVT